MKVAFRADASHDIGTGHVMRCLTLADALREKGADCYFLCREHPGNMLDYIRGRDFVVENLPFTNGAVSSEPLASEHPTHISWLGVTQGQDAQQCAAVLKRLQPDWIIVDHYGLDSQWEKSVKLHCGKLMVIDDLADRPHDCTLLLDQNLGREAADYDALLPEYCTTLIGPTYALLRPEFAQLRPYSLARRKNPKLEHILISMGGVDKENVTCEVLDALQNCTLPRKCRITVIMGPHAPWLEQVRVKASKMPWATEVQAGVGNMGQLMADSDLAIGGAGSTSWERCCLGLPTVLVILARNQMEAGISLEKSQAALMLELNENMPGLLCATVNKFARCENDLLFVSKRGAVIVDGLGCARVTDVFFQLGQ
jgi:UDP-2,4-diacetamido-2,4,6-trideoxy-beta-L-altropyranose hydrolase